MESLNISGGQKFKLNGKLSLFPFWAEFGSNDNREAAHSLYTSSYPLFGVKTCEELENERFRFGDWENIFQTCQSTMRKSVLCENSDSVFKGFFLQFILISMGAFAELMRDSC